MIETHLVSCPYCGEGFETTVDTSAGNQDYIEDCYVCCQPIEFSIQTDSGGNLINVELRSGNE